jgi:hypothetical protein
MPGQYILIGNRWTYFPAFFNERLTGHFTDPKGNNLSGPNFWSCTFTALLYGINFAFLGQHPARSTQAEIVALALESGDETLRNGSSTSQMQAALTKRYKHSKGQEKRGQEGIRAGLKNGEMLIGGLDSDDLSDHFRRFIGDSGALHRAAFVGYRKSGKIEQTRILDPMAVPSKTHFPTPEDRKKYAGEWFPLDDLFAAVWGFEQIWFQPGEYLEARKLVVVRRFNPALPVPIRKGATIVSFDPRFPPRKVIQRRFPEGSGTRAEAIVSFTSGGKTTEYFRVPDGGGVFGGLLLMRVDPGLDVTVPGGAPAPVAPATVTFAVPSPIVVANDLPLPDKGHPPDVLSTPLSSNIDDDPAAAKPPDEKAAEPA